MYNIHEPHIRKALNKYINSSSSSSWPAFQVLRLWRVATMAATIPFTFLQITQPSINISWDEQTILIRECCVFFVSATSCVRRSCTTVFLSPCIWRGRHQGWVDLLIRYSGSEWMLCKSCLYQNNIKSIFHKICNRRPSNWVLVDFLTLCISLSCTKSESKSLNWKQWNKIINTYASVQ